MREPPRSSGSFDQLVVVGSSAGGIEALSILVGSLPADLAAPVVIAQHLDPSRPSHLVDILARKSTLPVRSVADSEKLLPGTVYVVPSNRHIEINDHSVRVRSDATRRPTPSVDLLLATAAGVFGEQLVAVILTGSGSDGAAGAHAVKAAGGTVVIQDPATAAFPSMPNSLAAPLVDAVIPLEGIGPYLGTILGEVSEGASTSDPDLPALLAQVRTRRGIDFSAYKPPTIERRLRRRMATAGVTTIGAYLAYLETHPEEEEQLVADFLIKVTRFFRDPALFKRLGDQVLPELVDAAVDDGRELRLWSAGCATGEEAYSLALLVADILATRKNPPAVRIFATDLDEAALAFARRGVYPATALADVPPDLVARHFEQRDGMCEARKALRSLIIFGTHDLAQRPPFPRTDLVLCRNVLIYFTPELQQRALDIFAFSLRDGGYLVLGKSETPRPVDQAFTVVDRPLRLYRRQGQKVHLPAESLASTGEVWAGRQVPVVRSAASLELALRRADGAVREAQATSGRAEDLVRRLPVGIVVVDRTYDIVIINGIARELLGVHGLAIGQDLIHLAQRIPSTALRTAIDAVGRGGAPQRLADVVTVETATGTPRHLAVSCHPDQLAPDATVQTVLVLVEDVTPLVLSRLDAEDAGMRVERLTAANQELLAANRELTDTLDLMREQVEELHLATAAAQVSAEEIETLNEELQSTNEELETLNEEAQASMEELNVANDELQARAAETEELAATHAAERSRLETVLTSMADAVVVVDRTGRAVLTNAAYDALIGTLGEPFIPEDELGAPMAEEATPQARAARGEAFRIDFMATSRDGSRRWFEATGQPLRIDEVGTGVVVIRDITERKGIAGQLWHQANHDALTGLPNRMMFMERLQQTLGEHGAAAVAVIFLDLDGFKVVNDSLGHEFGDRLLVAAADRLASCLRAGDVLARFGGDEFTVMVEDVAEAGEATKLAERLQAALVTPFTLDEHTLMISASFGVVLSSDELPTPTDMLRAADVALYRAKANGKGSQAVFDAVRDSEGLAQLDRETELRHALERGELRLHYQPQIDLRTDRLVGVEALVRWQHPTDGLLPPARFIRLAEATGLIVPLGRWILGESCRQVMAWDQQLQTAGVLDLCVNVSPVQLHAPDLVGQVEDVLRETGFSPGRLVLEITEQGLVDAAIATDRTVEALLALGVRVAIDDFGAYQAGLGYLRRWPMHVLKLDQSLVHDLGENMRSREIVAAVASLAKTLGMTVIGEGIETAEQVAMLRELGCDWGQGYLLAPPLPPEELTAVLESGVVPHPRVKH